MGFSVNSVDGIFGEGLLTPLKGGTKGLLFLFQHECWNPECLTELSGTDAAPQKVSDKGALPPDMPFCRSRFLATARCFDEGT